MRCSLSTTAVFLIAVTVSSHSVLAVPIASDASEAQVPSIHQDDGHARALVLEAKGIFARGRSNDLWAAMTQEELLEVERQGRERYREERARLKKAKEEREAKKKDEKAREAARQKEAAQAEREREKAVAQKQAMYGGDGDDVIPLLHSEK